MMSYLSDNMVRAEQFEQLQKIQKAGKKATVGNRVSSCHSEARNPWTEPLKPVAPKTQICWLVPITIMINMLAYTSLPPPYAFRLERNLAD
jgi:hypothetical protein